MLVERNGTIRVGRSKVKAVDVYDIIMDGYTVDRWVRNFSGAITAEDVAEAIAWVEAHPDEAEAVRASAQALEDFLCEDGTDVPLQPLSERKRAMIDAYFAAKGAASPFEESKSRGIFRSHQ